VEAKDELLKVNAAVIKDMNVWHEDKVKEMTSKLGDAEKKVEKMEQFEKSLISSMLNPDLEEIMKTVKEQQQKIFDLEAKLKAKEEEEVLRQKSPSLEETVQNDVKAPVKSNPSEAMLKLRGINVSLVKTDDEKKKPNIENKVGGVSFTPGSQRRLEDILKLKNRNLDIRNLKSNLEARKTYEAADRDSEEENYDSEEGEESQVPVKAHDDKVEGQNRLENLLRFNKNLNIQKAKPAGETKAKSSEEEESEEEEDNSVNETIRRVKIKKMDPLEEEKQRRRIKREQEEKDEEDAETTRDPFWFSGPCSPARDVEEERMKRKYLDEELEECLQCFKGWVHECLEDIYELC